MVPALHVALAAIDRQVFIRERASALPDNAGKPRSDEDDRQLADLFDAGRPVADIATAFHRTRGSIVGERAVGSGLGRRITE